MTTLDTATARQSLALDMYQTGILYAQKAQTLNNIALQLENASNEDTSEIPLDASTARNRATYAALCAEFLNVAVKQIRNGEYDWELLQKVNQFTKAPTVPTDASVATGS